jgi:hypothetical protein
MTVTLTSALIAAPGQQFSLSDLISVTAAASNPEYLVLTGFDRDEYSAASTGATFSLSGNGSTVSTVKVAGGGDEANIGIVFTDTSQGYYNSTYGYLSNIDATASKDNYRSTYLSLYGYGTAGTADPAQLSLLTTLANASTGDPGEQFFAAPPAGGTYFGSVDVVTRSNYVDPTPNVATPSEVAQVGLGFVGTVWNSNGCWVLVSNITAAAGASLPVNSSDPNAYAPPANNGAWIVAYNSANATSAQQESWEAQLRPGDIVDYNQFCGGHIFTVVSGYGYNAQLVDNTGNSANDGAVNDIVIQGAHGVNDTFVQGHGLIQDVVIYRLDTPVITALAPVSTTAGAKASFAGDFSVEDPAGKAIVSYQVYDTANGSFSVNGAAQTAHSSATALTLTAAQMSSATFSAAASDTIMIRASNGSYWGDWQSLPVDVGAGNAAPILQATSTGTVVRTGTQISLSSLVTSTSAGSSIASYSIYDPAGGEWGSGKVVLNGVTPISQTTDSSGGTTYQIAAADFAKLTYAGGGYVQNGENLTISATNAAGMTSVALQLPIWSDGLSGNEISHFLTQGTVVPISSLFALTGVDPTIPVKYYLISTDYADGEQINLNGATNQITPANFLDSTGWSHYEIAASDLSKLTFTVGSGVRAAGLGDEIIVTAVDSANSTANFFPKIHTATEPALISATPQTVLAGNVVALSSLFTVKDAGTVQFYHIFDSADGGTVNLNGVENLMGVQAGVGEYLVSAQDLAKVTYTGGTGTENLLIATSPDVNAAAWSAETSVQVTGAVNGTSAAAAQDLSAPLVVMDSAADIAANLDALQAKLAAGQLASISVNDPSAAALSISAAQATSDAKLIAEITGNFVLDIDASAANLTFSGLSGHGSVAVSSGTAADYSVTAAGNGSGIIVTDLGTGRSSVDHLSNLTALQFSDTTVFVAQAPSANGLTTGNVTELYSAVLARTPDVSGLAFYQAAITANPGLTLTQLATYFLNSSEYTANAAHAYAQSAAGDEQFIADSYQNLLHRTPSASEVSFYEANVLAPAVANLTPGTTAYANAQLQAHALMLVYFSNAPEFVSDVQVTAAHPADANHWLVLI